MVAGTVTVTWRLLVRYSVRLQRVGSTLIERVLRFRWSRRTIMYVKNRLLCCMLFESNYDAWSLSLSPRRWKGGVRTGHRRWTADVSLKARRHQRSCDDNDQPQARWWQLHQQHLARSRLHLFRLLVNEPRSYNHVHGVTTSATATRLSGVFWHAWRFLVRYNNRRRRRRVDQNDCSFLSFLFHF